MCSVLCQFFLRERIRHVMQTSVCPARDSSKPMSVSRSGFNKVSSTS